MPHLQITKANNPQAVLDS